ncbi:MAG: O-antigen ligase family protein [Candidatus Omnitrophica bacterium]|nr:O-antigen ligase family protein [Candidatus Omnitrophota bacterium]
MTRSIPWAPRIQYAAVVAFAAVLPLGQAPAEITLVIGLAAWVFRAVRERRGSQLLRNPLSGLLVLWFLAALVSMLNSVDPAASLHGLRKLLKGFGLYFLVVDTVGSRDALRGVVAGSLAGLSLVVGDGLWQWAAGRDLIYGHVPVNELPTGKTILRLSAMFGHSASLAMYLVSWAPLAIAAGLAGGRRWRRWLFGLGALAAVVLVFSRTRGGILGFACALPLMSWWLRSWIPAAVGVAAAALQVATVPPAVAEWAAAMPTLLHQFTEPERLMYWQAALRMVQAHPLIGVGVNTFVKAYPSYRVAGDPYAALGPYAHNQYLQVAAELGLVGLAVFAGVLVRLGLALRRGLAARSGHPFEAAVAAGVGAGLVGYLILGGLESSLFYGRGSLIFWTLAGLLVAVERRYK